MRYSDRNTHIKRPYSKISLKKRQQLVQLVLQNGLSVSKAGKKMKIKLTTARLILKKYKETGTFPMKKFKEHDVVPQNTTRHVTQPLEMPTERIQEQVGVECQMDNFYPSQCMQTHPQPFLQYSQPIFYYFWPLGGQEFGYY